MFYFVNYCFVEYLRIGVELYLVNNDNVSVIILVNNCKNMVCAQNIGENIGIFLNGFCVVIMHREQKQQQQ